MENIVTGVTRHMLYPSDGPLGRWAGHNKNWNKWQLE